MDPTGGTDLVTFGEAMLRYSPPGALRLETTGMLEVGVAGAESNIAVAASRLGADAVWISKVPDTPLGRRVANFLHAAGLETDIVWSERGRQGTYYVEMGPAPRGTDVIYDRDNASITTATADELPTERIRDATMFATTGITPALSHTLAETTAELLASARDAGTLTVFDLNYRSKLWSTEAAKSMVESLLPDIDMFFIGEESLHTVFDETGSPEALLPAIAERWNLDVLVMTRGAWGAVAMTEDEYVEQRAFETETVDPIGTGDAFVGGVLASLLDGDDIERALAIGAATASLKRTIPGDIAVVTREEVERIITTGGGGIDR